jgi:formate dehydrogenase iron-sulfur subunit
VRADAHSTYGAEAQPRMGFFTDTTVCIGCKACEVACKEWNLVPEDGLKLTGTSYDNTGELSANTWRHVAFIEQLVPAHGPVPGTRTEVSREPHGSASTPSGSALAGSPLPTRPVPDTNTEVSRAPELRWLMSSDVCKHCSHAGCLDVCPTGAIFRTEFGTVVIQDDVCNGCGYCIPACPFGVISRRDEIPGVVQGDGGAHKCTLCYDRLQDGLEPACAKACPTDSIQFGPLDELVARARERCEEVVEAGVEGARLYGHDENDGVGGFGAFFLLLDEPEVYGLPPDPVVPTRNLPSIWGAAAVAAGALGAAVALAFSGSNGG